MFEVKFSNKAEKFLGKCEPKLLARLKELFAHLAIEPVPFKQYDLTKLTGSGHMYRIRLSSHRVVYQINSGQNAINVLKIERRSGSTYDF